MTGRELALRRTIVHAFAETGEPPAVDDREALRSLAERHVVVLDPDEPGRILMAHPFAAPGAGTRVEIEAGTRWGNCAWDGLGIAAALGAREATVESNGVTLRVRRGRLVDDALFHVLVPARHWWDDIRFT